MQNEKEELKQSKYSLSMNVIPINKSLADSVNLQTLAGSRMHIQNVRNSFRELFFTPLRDSHRVNPKPSKFNNTNNEKSGINSDLELNDSVYSKKKQNISSSKDTAKKNLFDDKESYNSDVDSDCEKKSYHGLKKELEENTPTQEQNTENPIFLYIANAENGESTDGIFKINGTFWDIFTKGRILGEGTSAVVRKVTRKSDKKEFAVKIVRTRDEEIVELLKTEYRNLKKICHDNIVKVYELYIDDFHAMVYSVMEYFNGEEMFSHITKICNYTEATAILLFKKLIQGIKHLHENGIIHRDQKPNNILVSPCGEKLKITDFNVAKFYDGHYKNINNLSKYKFKMYTYTGTQAFSAPEILLVESYYEAVDMWSAGTVLYTMLCGHQPFYKEEVSDQIQQIANVDYNFDDEIWSTVTSEAKDLISCLLVKDPVKRLSPDETLSHKWFKSTVNTKNCNTQEQLEYNSKYSESFHRTLSKNVKHLTKIRKKGEIVEDIDEIEGKELMSEDSKSFTDSINDVLSKNLDEYKSPALNNNFNRLLKSMVETKQSLQTFAESKNLDKYCNQDELSIKLKPNKQSSTKIKKSLVKSQFLTVNDTGLKGSRASCNIHSKNKGYDHFSDFGDDIYVLRKNSMNSEHKQSYFKASSRSFGQNFK